MGGLTFGTWCIYYYKYFHLLIWTDLPKRLLTLKHLHKFDLCRSVDKKNKKHTWYNFPHNKWYFRKCTGLHIFGRFCVGIIFLSELFLNPLKYWNIYKLEDSKWYIFIYIPQLKRVCHYEIDKAIFTKLYKYILLINY